MSAAALTLADAAAMLRAAVRDKSYRRTPIGRQVGRYMRALRWSGSEHNTLDTYEIPLARLALDFADFDSLERFTAPDGIELVRDFLDRHWGECQPATRGNRLAIIRSFLQWGVGEGLLAFNPAAKIRGPRAKDPERQAYAVSVLHQLVNAQTSLRDQVCLELLAMLGLRKNELRLLRVGDVDLTRGEVTIRGKGRKVVVLPIGFKRLAGDLYLLIQGGSLDAEEFLLYPRSARRRPMNPASVHRWFKRCLRNAGLPESTKLHELRHSAADALWRASGDLVKAQQLLRHSSIETTRRYLHPVREDLMEGLRLVDAVWDEES